MELLSKSAKRQRASSITSETEFDSPGNSRNELPVCAYRTQICQALSSGEHKVVLVTAATGSGKSTQIPAFLLNTTHRIAVTQPRRVAAMTLAERVAKENACRLGDRIGYRVRFDDRTTSNTQVVYVTDGMLLREAMVDPMLNRYSVIFLDESHERSLQTDILLGVVYRARKQRGKGNHPLRVVVMSATLQVETFVNFFGQDQVQVIEIPGRQHPVQVLYTREHVEDYIEAMLTTVVQIHENEEPGDILAFLPGQEEIEDLAGLLRHYLESEDNEAQWTGDKVEALQKRQHIGGASHLVNNVLICLLYAALPPEAQLAVFADKPPGCDRKVILATNIAETSVTIPGIRYVVDSGKYKSRQMMSTGMESLTVESVSQAQAKQRTGRAGRVSAGLCFRLYSEEAFASLDVETTPEILRVNLSQVILQLKGMGIQDPAAFDFVTPPDTAGLVRATKVLYALGALDDKLDLTDHGRKLAKLPLDPTFGNLLLKSEEYACTKEILTAVSVLSAENIFYRPSAVAQKAAIAHRRFTSHEGDLSTSLRVYDAWKSEAVYVPPNRGGRKAERKLLKDQGGRNRLPHEEWCRGNFISGRSMVRAFHIRQQLEGICARESERNGLGMDVSLSFGKNEEAFFKCLAAGLFLQAASRVKADTTVDGRGKSGDLQKFQRGRYRTMLGNDLVSIHPTSTLFGRNPPPACVVYTELVTTKKTYIRGVTQIREEWLQEVAPSFYSK